ncbi:hypothetical protein [Burkholderia pseudomultivorans]|uniref:hypothetical protein n=1 Tax=Burkholderia pseudomultivorans TaxID=1207504 RepID=UPI000B1B9EB8|nr:hypothetical protein [Burkholderia pseudomultivorans]
MLFVTLHNVLRAIGARVVVPDWASLAQQDAKPWLENINESNYRYSDAAGLLDYHLMSRDSSLQPRWLDIRDGTGYPRPSDVARDDGMAFLLEQGQWYRRWLNFNKEFHLRSVPSTGRWASLPPTAEDYARDCPQMPMSSEKYEKRIHEIVFEIEDIIDFLDRSHIPHVLTHPQSQQVLSISATPEDHSDVRTDSTVEVHHSDLPTNDAAQIVGLQSNVRHGHKTASRGRKAHIEKAILCAIELAAPNGDDTQAVFDQLVKIASERPDEFPPLIGYMNGQVIFGVGGRRLEYKKKALAEFLARRRARDIGK